MTTKEPYSAREILEALTDLWPGLIDPDKDIGMSEMSEVISDLAQLLEHWGGK